jgi:Mg-chelatase subunit ChlD
MCIEVIGAENATITAARAYAEFRVFATLARHARRIRRVTVVLEQVERKGTSGRIACAVHVVFDSSGSARVRAEGPHARGAIDRAAARVGNVMRRRSQRGITLADLRD